MKGIKFKLDKRGKVRAYYYSRSGMRWFPMGLDEAQLLIATGAAYEVPADSLFA